MDWLRDAESTGAFLRENAIAQDRDYVTHMWNLLGWLRLGWLKIP